MNTVRFCDAVETGLAIGFCAGWIFGMFLGLWTSWTLGF